MITHQRDTFSNSNCGDSGFNAIKTSLISGRKAMGNFNSSFFEIGTPLNALVVSNAHPLITSSSPENLCNTLIYSSDNSMLKGTIVNGDLIINEGVHENEITTNFLNTIQKLKFR